MSLSLCIGFSALEISFWCFHAAFFAYASAYILHCGISSTAVSLMLSAYLLCAFAGSIFWGRYCDEHRTNRKPFILSVLACFLLMLAIYRFAGVLPVVSVCFPVLGFFFLPHTANADAWVLSAAGHDQKIFGRIRSMPSLAYAFVCALFGRLIASHGYLPMVLGGGFFLLIALISAWFLPDSPQEDSRADSRITSNDLRRLLATGPYMTLIVILFLIGLASSPLLNLKIVVYENVGGNVSHVGVDSFIGALTQVPFIAFAALTQRLPLKSRFFVMSFFPLAMLLCARFAVSPTMLFVSAFLYNVSYGVLLPTMRGVTETYVDSGLRNLAHNLSDSVFNCFSGVIALAYTGMIVDGFGIRMLLSISAFIAALPVIVSLLYRQR